MRRSVLLGIVVGAVVVSSALGWWAGSQIRSPAEEAAAAAPPEPSNITVEVEQTTLSADVVTRGDIVYDEPVTVGLSGSFAIQPEALVVTAAVERDSQIVEGGRAVEVAGRPVFFLTGEIPMYRDLRPGSTGPDVFQVESALARLGFFAGAPDEDWNDDTGGAVASWYDATGYRPNGLSAEDEVVLRSARDRVTAARGSVADAEAAYRDISQGVGQAEQISAQAQVDAAEAALELAQLDATKLLGDAEAIEASTQVSLDRAAYGRANAEQRLDEAESGVHPDTGKPPTEEQLAALRAAVRDKTAAESEAQAAHDEAAFQLRRVRIEQGSLVDQAFDAVRVARAALSDLGQGLDRSAIDRQLKAARDELTVAESDLSDLEAELGTWIPAGELVFLARLPVRVDQVVTERGSIITDSFMIVSGSELAVRASVSEQDARRLTIDQPVEIENPDAETAIPGTIGRIADRPGTNNVPEDRVYVEILPNGELPESIIGQNVRVIIPVSSTGGDVLAVPAAALSATADGSTIVEVDDDGEVRTVTVQPGLAAGGLVEVTPVEGSLAAGDQVIVGRDSPVNDANG